MSEYSPEQFKETLRELSKALNNRDDSKPFPDNYKEVFEVLEREREIQKEYMYSAFPELIDQDNREAPMSNEIKSDNIEIVIPEAALKKQYGGIFRAAYYWNFNRHLSKGGQRLHYNNDDRHYDYTMIALDKPKEIPEKVRDRFVSDVDHVFSFHGLHDYKAKEKGWFACLRCLTGFDMSFSCKGCKGKGYCEERKSREPTKEDFQNRYCAFTGKFNQSPESHSEENFKSQYHQNPKRCRDHLKIVQPTGAKDEKE